MSSDQAKPSTTQSASGGGKKAEQDGGGGGGSDGVLPAAVLRALGDRSYEKRKGAALEIEQLVKEIHKRRQVRGETADKESDEIARIIKVLVNQYAFSLQANFRKGGLIGLAATAIALLDDTNAYLELLLPPILKCFQDQEPRVRYYACEALYNVAKVVRGNVCVFFNEIFDGLCKLFADPDIDVKNGAQLLDRLLRDVVTESDSFEIERFIPLLRDRIAVRHPHIRQLLIGWITVLDSVPDIDMLSYLPEYLGGIFDMLSDSEKDIRQQAYACLSEFLRGITQNPRVDLGPMVAILVAKCESSDKFTRLTALTWISEFLVLGKTKLLPMCSGILGACLYCTADAEEEIRRHSQQVNDSLRKLVEATNEPFEIEPVLSKLTAHVRSKYVPTRMASLTWVAMLLTKMPHTIFKHLDMIFPSLLTTLSDTEDQVVRLNLEVLARIALDGNNFQMVLDNIMKLFSSNRKLLEQRGSVIIRQLSVLLDGESIFRALAKILADEDDMEFASIMVQTLNLILLTSAELFELRGVIKQCLVTDAGRDLFVTLYKSWSHNPVATFSLCLLAQAYELASALVFQMANVEVTVGFLMQIDKLVQLIESPIFVHLRLQLLEPAKNPFLLKSLYGLLMLLPQSSAFNSLKTRLQSVSTLGVLNCIPESKFLNASQSKKIKETKQLDFQELLALFEAVQQKHTALRKKSFKKHRLVAAAGAASSGATSEDSKTPES